MMSAMMNFQGLLVYCILPFSIAVFSSLVLTPLVRVFAVRYKFVVFPKKDRWRSRVVASLGGVSIFASFLVSYLVFTGYDIKTVGFIAGGLGIFTLGLLDDIIHIKADTKLLGQIMIACAMIMCGIRFHITATPLINIPLTIFWLVGIINAFNLLDNMDGLSAGVASISALTLCAHSVLSGNAQLAILSAAILGAALGFLRYNFSPAKIFMGDCGSMFLGYSLAIAALIGASQERSGLILTMAVPVLLLIVPIFDTILVTFTRTMNYRPISQGGRDHTSHRLVALGLSEKKAVLFLYAISAICGFGVILYTKLNFIVISICLAALAVALCIFGIFLSSEAKVYSQEELENLKGKKKTNGKILLNGFVYNKRRIGEVILDFVLISASYILAFLLRFDGALPGTEINLVLESLPVILIVKLSMLYSFGLYRGVWRYAGVYDVISVFKATLLSSVVCVVSILFFFRWEDYPRSVFIIDWFVTFVSVSGVRILFRVYKEYFANIRLTGRRLLIFGAGDAGELALREIRQNRSLNYRPIGFVDDDAKKQDRVIHGIRVLGKGTDLEKLIYRYKADEVLMAVPATNKKKISEIREICNRLNVAYNEVSRLISVTDK
ncbi:MAG: hypothetical protein ABH825_00825 [Candidatus Omnitrophota bacterium]